MTRLNAELHRLYEPLIDPEGRVRALVLTLARPADWASTSTVWQAVQADLSLPAPAIAVSGVDGYQLWFSLEEAVPVAEARAFLGSLQRKHLSHIAPARIETWPSADPATPQAVWPAEPLPVRLVQAGQWSAFVAPDLAPIFEETPWLDIPPSQDGQADLLSRLRSIKPGEWQAALATLQPAPSAVAQPSVESTSPHPLGEPLDPRQFLLNVMGDSTVALALRIEAAKALLPLAPARD